MEDKIEAYTIPGEKLQKLLPISSCNECKFNTSGTLDSYCVNNGRRKFENWEGGDSIPFWCELSNKEERVNDLLHLEKRREK